MSKMSAIHDRCPQRKNKGKSSGIPFSGSIYTEMYIYRKLRNRLSQKAIRERRMAHIHHLEQQLASSRQQGGSERIDELLEENAKLREGLHSTRKKLLSISTTASHVADNIKPILHIEGKNVAIGEVFAKLA